MRLLTRALIAASRAWPPPAVFDASRESLLENRRLAAGPFIRTLQRFANLSTSTVLDLGAGEGGVSIALAEEGAPAVIASDVGLATLMRGGRAARSRRLPVYFVGQDAARLALADGSVDAIITIATFEHFDSPEGVLRECYRVLRPGGVLYAIFEPYYGPSGGHVFDFIRFPWVHLLVPEPTLLEAWCNLAKEDPERARHNFTIERTADGARRRWLNHISAKRFFQLVTDSQFEQVELEVRYWRNLHRRPLLSRLLAPFSNYLTADISIVLRRPVV